MMILEMGDIRKAYGKNVVIPGLSLTVNEGEFVGVIGPNGAGKSTLFGVISGEHVADSGSIQMAGEDISGLDAAARCHRGIARTFQIPQPFLGLSVYENTLVSATFGAGLHGDEARESARAALLKTGLLKLANNGADSLTLLQRKRLELARAIATQPRLLLLDEVAGGLTDAEVGELLELIVSINQSGVTVLWIEHLVHALVSVAERLVVLAEGRIVADGIPKEVLDVPAVRETYLGSDLEDEEADAVVAQAGGDDVRG
ncbi:ATP-binding cassette domain-containing protein [Amphritea atlantica]|uniref:ATP-binding cassette domain-containing protein n=1 Tax=Amphritea atlantica TaxID=355243 RepID=A0ABY5GXB3_9GAMM|nr:ATP-binding cassette domain-containing protein [Amphritea atlantica]